MRPLLLLTLLLPPVWPAQNVAPADDGSALVVLAAKWSKSRQKTVARPETVTASPAAAVIPANRNYERNQRNNDPRAARDLNADTIDGRSAALEKSVQEARAPKPKSVDVYAYRVKLRNEGEKAIDVLFWEYQFTESSNPSNVVRRQFLCGVQIKPKKEKELQATSYSGPSGSISAESLGSKTASPYAEKAVINRVEYADGTIWQRKGWNFAAVKPAVARAIQTPWGLEMCRSL
jgi:hypothetical protein